MNVMRCQELCVILHGAHILEAKIKADEIVDTEVLPRPHISLAHLVVVGLGTVYINGFDHPNIIAGAGTMGIEILNQVPKTDVIIVPVCGGGLITGIALAVKTLNPSIQVIVRLADTHAPSERSSVVVVGCGT
ncbi:hypothetical protein DYB32_010345 [Aphanomyces invadans]|uniref:Tryptophan synthase beta chain-like PALP domain-containing protein n=1 Tax=Aphanomyces invadans TaxID=157072 RepID=A0A3R6ZH86_9STRA|nr:hypothetical protein DYB32_010345 [Aphanomyces invadans]